MVDIAPTPQVRALHESGMAYPLYLVDMSKKPEFDALGVSVSRSVEDLLKQVGVALDAPPAGGRPIEGDASSLAVVAEGVFPIARQDDVGHSYISTMRVPGLRASPRRSTVFSTAWPGCR
jgi:hypothetical protein